MRYFCIAFQSGPVQFYFFIIKQPVCIHSFHVNKYIFQECMFHCIIFRDDLYYKIIQVVDCLTAKYVSSLSFIFKLTLHGFDIGI